MGYVTSYLLYTGFAAGITSLLLQQTSGGDLSYKSLLDYKPKIVSLTKTSFFKEYILVDDVEILFKYLKQENTVALAPQIYAEQFLARREALATKYRTVRVPTYLLERSFLLHQKSDVWKNVLNKGFTQLSQSGLLKQALARYLLAPCGQNPHVSYFRAGIEHVGSSVAILIVGFVSSSVFLVFELVYALYMSRCRGIHRSSFI